LLLKIVSVILIIPRMHRKEQDDCFGVELFQIKATVFIIFSETDYVY